MPRLNIFVQLITCVGLFVTPWTVVRQTPLSVGIPRQECWSRLPCPSPGSIPNPGAGRFFTTEPPGRPQGSRFSNFEHLKIALSHGLNSPLWWGAGGVSSNRWYWWGFQRDCELLYPLLPVCSEALQPFLLPLLPPSLHFSCCSRGTEPPGQLIRERRLQQHDRHTVTQLLGQGLVSLISVSADEQGRYCTPGW